MEGEGDPIAIKSWSEKRMVGLNSPCHPCKSCSGCRFVSSAHKAPGRPLSRLVPESDQRRGVPCPAVHCQRMMNAAADSLFPPPVKGRD